MFRFLRRRFQRAPSSAGGGCLGLAQRPFSSRSFDLSLTAVLACTPRSRFGFSKSYMYMRCYFHFVFFYTWENFAPPALRLRRQCVSSQFVQRRTQETVHRHTPAHTRVSPQVRGGVCPPPKVAGTGSKCGDAFHRTKAIMLCEQLYMVKMSTAQVVRLTDCSCKKIGCSKGCNNCVQSPDKLLHISCTHTHAKIRTVTFLEEKTGIRFFCHRHELGKVQHHSINSKGSPPGAPSIIAVAISSLASHGICPKNQNIKSKILI